MSGTCAPEDPATIELEEKAPSAASGRRTPSILGLSIVSGLNVLSLAFIAYHFAGHPDEAPATPADPSSMRERPVVAEPGETPEGGVETDLASGNVDLVPAQRFILQIASHADMAIETTPHRGEDVPAVSTEARNVEPAPASSPRTEGPAPADRSSRHWVQLGAMSKESTARRYWSGLKTRHGSLLRDRDARYFGPDDVGGSLFHIRLGPMTGDAAAELCKALVAEGSDCFCIAPEDQASR